MEHQQPPSSSSSSPSSSSSLLKAKQLDYPLYTIGFEIEEVSATKVSGSLRVTYKCCQPFKVLHGGVSAMISESLTSIGAHLASGLNRVAGIHLSINHVKHAELGDLVFAQALPLTVGRKVQVWEVQLWKANPNNVEGKTVISSSRVTLLCNLPVPENAKDADKSLRKYAKL